VKPIVAVNGDPSMRLLLLQLGVETSALPADVQEMVLSGAVQVTEHELRLGYEHFNAEEALQRLLPEGVEVPRSFETIGHVAHFNLRDEQLPYRFQIGRVILDKNASIQTVVTKVGALTNEFRTFDMEVIAGRDDTNVIVSENGMKMKFNFREVYWNSRLSEERVRLLSKVASSDVVCDIFAGVGAFALFAASKGCVVYANDLNPAGAEAIRRNAVLNKCRLEVFNLDARECVRAICRLPYLEGRLGAPVRVHVVMNLPELALDFLDAFREMVFTRRSELFSSSPVELQVHCYCFARDKQQPEAEVHPRLITALGVVPDNVEIRAVRDVAPKKNMFCVEFGVLLHAGLHASPDADVSTSTEPDAKRAKAAA